MNLKWANGQMVVDKADSRNVFFYKNGGNARQMKENLMKILFINDELNFHHWSKEFVNAYLDILKTTVSHDDKNNSKRARYLNQLLIDGPYNSDGSNFVHSSLCSVDSAFADENLTYDIQTIADALEEHKNEILYFFKMVLDSQNKPNFELRMYVYSLLEKLRDTVNV